VAEAHHPTNDRDTAMTGRGATYDAAFYDEIDSWSRSSAAAVVPWIVDALAPSSVIDVGCGHGAWLAAFKACGVEEVLGLDGDHVDRSALEIEPSEFRAVDLREPPVTTEHFDLVVSLEVAEHLPSADGDRFIGFLTRCAPVALFSAAIPGQGGRGHVNEQWPPYWSDRFDAHDFLPVDALRPRFWNDDRVQFFFAQNTLVYAHRDVLADVTKALAPETAAPSALALVHPEMLRLLVGQARARRNAPPSLRHLARALPGAAKRAARERWTRLRHRSG
jgi:SAM-dependent methyltransferase